MVTMEEVRLISLFRPAVRDANFLCLMKERI